MTGSAPTVTLALDSTTPYAPGAHLTATATIGDPDTYTQTVSGGVDDIGVGTFVEIVHTDTAGCAWSWKSTGIQFGNGSTITLPAPAVSDVLVCQVTDSEGNVAVAEIAVTVQDPMLVGFDVSPIGTETAAVAIARVRKLVPTAQAVRLYNRPGHGFTETPWGLGPMAAMPAGALPVVSTKDSPNPAAASAYINAATGRWVWINHHEPEGDLPVSQFRADQATARKLIDASPNGHLCELAECYTGYAQRHGSKPGYMVKDMWSGTATILAMDLYRDATLDGATDYPDPKAFCAILVDTAKTLKGPDGKPPKIAVFELGGTLVPGDTNGARRAAWILAVIAYLRSVGCIIACWWFTGGEDLTNDPLGLAALQKAITGK